MLAWKRLSVPLDELQEVSRVREVWVSLLRLLPSRLEPRQALENGWIYYYI